MRRHKRKPHNLLCFWIVANAVIAHCVFSIREVTSVAMADVPPVLSGVSQEGRELMSPSGGAIITTSCVNTESAAHESANAEFEAAASQLEELGYSYELSNDGVHFSREPNVGGSILQPPGPPLLRHSRG
jgi:hypothetical protein